MRICQIGLGNWGKNHARVLSGLKRAGHVDELFFFDVNTSLMEKTASIHRGKTVQNLDNLDVDAVNIVVPAHLHHKVARPFIEKGIKTFIEKPFTDNSEDAQDLIDLASNPERDIMVGHIFRYHGGVKRAHKLVKQGVIGELQKIEIRRLAFGYPRKDNGVILSLAIHDLDLLRYFNNEKDPVSIAALSSTIYGPTEDHAFIHVDFEETVGVLEESWMSYTDKKIRSLSLQGTEGELGINFLDPSIVHVNSKYFDMKGGIVDNGIFSQRIEYEEPLKAEIEHFVQQSKQNSPYLTGPRLGLKAVLMCEIALESAKTGERQQFEGL